MLTSLRRNITKLWSAPAPQSSPETTTPELEPKPPVHRRYKPKTGVTAQYPDTVDYTEEMRELAARHPGKARVVELGKTVQGRVIHGLSIGHGPIGVAVNGLIHACEWTTAKPGLSAAREVLEHRPELLDKLTYLSIPVSNSDGYELSRLAQPSRRANANLVDLNRNFPVNWGTHEDGTSKQFDVEFGGTGASPLSEPESQALADVVKEDGLRGMLDLHSHGEFFLYPESERPKEYQALIADMNKAVDDRYDSLTIQEFQPITGSLADFGEANGVLSVGVELGKKHKPSSDEKKQVEQDGHNIVMAFLEHMAQKSPV